MKNSARVLSNRGKFFEPKRKKGFKLCFLLTLLLVILSSPKIALASISDCTATVTPTVVNINAIYSFDFFITNNDSGNSISWVQLTRPSVNFNVPGGGETITLSSVGIGAGSGADVSTPQVSVGDTPASSANWTVHVSDDPDGLNPTTCTGSLGTSIIDPDKIVTISNVVISNVTDSSATVSWETSTEASSEIDYGKTNSYGLVQTDSNQSMSHSFTLNSLDSNSTYHFDIKASNVNGTIDFGDNTFVTAVKGSTTVSEPQVVTKTVNVTPSPSPTPTPDIRPPTVVLNTDLSKPFSQAPQISGSAKDDTGVSKIEYSLDGGQNWLPVDNISAAGKKSTNFSNLIPSLDDGNYSLIIRAFDTSNNIGMTKKETLVIDRLPPEVSGILLSSGPQVVSPRADGSIVVLAGQTLKITLSTVGGPTSIDIFLDNTEKLDSYKFSLIKNTDNGLWSGNISLKNEGTYQLRFSAIDGAGNRTDRNLNKVILVGKGQITGPQGVIPNAKITVYYQEPVSKQWVVWDATPYSQNNPEASAINGDYGFYLPPGKYYLNMEAPGFVSQNSEFFELKSPTAINANFSVKPLKLLFSLGPIKIYYPDFSTLSVRFENNLPEPEVSVNPLLDKPLPFFNFQNQFRSDSLNGKPGVLVFLNTWSPSSFNQIAVLDKFAKNSQFNTVIIVEGEKSSIVNVFQKRGGYTVKMVSDPDASLAKVFSLNSLPATYFLDRKGMVKSIASGILNEDELANTLVNITQ